MILQMIILCLQLNLNLGQIYDEDVDIAKPALTVNHSPINEPAPILLAKINGCTCRENPNILVVCFGTKCDEFPSSVPVNISLFKLKVSAIPVIKKDDFALLSNIKAMEIEGNLKLTKLEPGCFQNMSDIENLTISSNVNLISLDANLFDGLINLRRLIASKNGFTHVSSVSIALSPKFVPNLTLLDLTENQLEKINQDEFYPMNGSSLTDLNMHLCAIKFIHPDCLEPLKKLNTLRLGQNMFNRTVITQLVERTLELGIPLDRLNLYEIGLMKGPPMGLLTAVGKSNISQLNMARNHFDHIEDDSFPDMPKLESLDLRDCLIMDVTPNAFRRMPNLALLQIGQNMFSNVNKGVLKETLKILDIAGIPNKYYGYTPSYFNLEDGIFENMSSLVELQLSYNNIGSVNKLSFVGLENLVILGLKNVSLFHIEEGTFLPLRNLLHLNLNDNPFPTVINLTANIFLGLNKLHVLLLAGCSIKNLTMKPSVFSNTPNLTYLNLERNGLFAISPHQFTPLKYLRRLILADNKLTPWSDRILTGLNLTLIDADENRFTYITTAMLEDFQTVNTLNLRGNPFSCDCTLYSVVTWLNGNAMKVKYHKTDDFIAQCVSPEEWRHSSIVQYMNYIKYSGECDDTNNNIVLICSFILVILFVTLIFILAYIYRWYLRYWMFLSRLNYRQHKIWNRRKHEQSNDFTNYQYDAFVSYCNEDRVFVRKLVAMLENYEPYLRLCVYERDFQIGSVISEAVLQSVAVSKRTLLVISNAFAKSQWCRWETQLAEYHQLFFHNDNSDGPDDTLLMIRLGDVSKEHMTPTLKYLMKTRIYLEWDSDPKKQKVFWEKLRTTLAAPKREVEPALFITSF